MDVLKIFSPVAAIGSALFGKKKKEEPKAPVVDDKLSRIKRERDAQRKYAASGRIGSMLDSDTLG